LIISFFYSLYITGSIYALAEQGGIDTGIVTSFTESDVKINYANTTQDFQNAINTQQSFGVVDLGALALYSGNIVLDLSSNFIFAFPSMLSVLFEGFFEIFNVNGYLQQEVLIWSKGILSIMGAIFLLQFLLGARTQTSGTF
jgi:hypothetical protein